MLTSKFSRASFIPVLKTETMFVIFCPLKFLMHSIWYQRYALQIVSVGFFWLKFTLTHSLWLCNGLQGCPWSSPSQPWGCATALADEGGIPGFPPTGAPFLPQLWGSHSNPALCYLSGDITGFNRSTPGKNLILSK